MKFRPLFLSLAALIAFAPGPAHAQSPASNGTNAFASAGGQMRPRLVSQPPAQTGQAQTAPTTAPKTVATPASTPAPATVTAAPGVAPAAQGQSSGATVVPSFSTPAPLPPIPLKPAQPLGVAKARKSVADAQRLLKSRLLPTASTPNLSFVTLAALEQETGKLHLLTLPKQTFLTRGLETQLLTSEGLAVRLNVVRPNYVNTAVRVFDLTGRQLTPLVVEYPIEKGGRFREMAYYTSAHPALVTPEVVRAGQAYVRTMVDLAAKRLRDKGKVITPEIVDIAERLCVVEHADHERFRNEDRATLFNEVFALFALNELDTYRYSVSSAGAGGMVQMIPPTYQMVRRQHPAVGLNPDFVLGMRNHGNALEAMLLYMQDTWNDLALNEDVLEAMRQSWATQVELTAAGYNSNPARLPGYIRRGGASWRYLIPRETQMYLQIYKSLESLVPQKKRGRE